MADLRNQIVDLIDDLATRCERQEDKGGTCITLGIDNEVQPLLDLLTEAEEQLRMLGDV